jgi:hypothetical protein
LSANTPSVVTPQAANQATARRSTPIAGGSGLVVVDLGVGDPAAVVEHGVHERHHRLAGHG